MVMVLDVAAFRVRFRIRLPLIVVFQNINSMIELLNVLYSTLLHLPPLKFHLVGGCWDRTQECATLALAVRRSTICSCEYHYHLTKNKFR
jgi:hypothetical protein